VSQTHKV